VKRILIAAIIAVGIHWLFLGIEFDRTRGGFSERPKSRIVTMTLVSRQPKKAESKPAINKRVPVNRNKKRQRKKSSYLNRKRKNMLYNHLMQNPQQFQRKPTLLKNQ